MMTPRVPSDPTRRLRSDGPAAVKAMLAEDAWIMGTAVGPATAADEHARELGARPGGSGAVGEGLAAGPQAALDIIDPRDTRSVLGMALSVVHDGPVEGARHYGVFRM